MQPPSGPLCRWVRRQLLTWFERFRRDLPWRQTRDPYAIWVSEVMLQQTQVATVIPFYKRFLAAFPNVETLAAAPRDDVLRLWQGLGYYRRARSLHESARLLTAHFDGAIPNDPEVLGGLPGMGRYTVGAVLSQAFDRRLPIIEANSRRVLARLFALPRSPGVEARLWRLAESLLPTERVGEYNQALMELGALVCTPSAPQCPKCPLKSRCRAHAEGMQAELPAAARPVQIEQVREVAIVPVHRGRALILQRPEQGRWAGLWEFPHGPIQPGESETAAAKRILHELAGLECREQRPLGSVNHSLTRFRIEMTCLLAPCTKRSFRTAFHVQGKWVGLRQLAELPLSSPQRRLVVLLNQARISDLIAV